MRYNILIVAIGNTVTLEEKIFDNNKYTECSNINVFLCFFFKYGELSLSLNLKKLSREIEDIEILYRRMQGGMIDLFTLTEEMYTIDNKNNDTVMEAFCNMNIEQV